jgi:hypothetical protein
LAVRGGHVCQLFVNLLELSAKCLNIGHNLVSIHTIEWPL